MPIQHVRCPRCRTVLILRERDIHLCPEKAPPNLPAKENPSEEENPQPPALLENQPQEKQ